MTNTTPSWSILDLKREAADGYVFQAIWQCGAQIGYDTLKVCDSCYFERPNNLIPFENLTEDMIIGWVKEELGAEKVAAIESKISAKIQSKLNPTVLSGLPPEPLDPNGDTDAPQ